MMICNLGPLFFHPIMAVMVLKDRPGGSFMLASYFYFGVKVCRELAYRHVKVNYKNIQKHIVFNTLFVFTVQWTQ